MSRLTSHFDYCKFSECGFFSKELAEENKCKFFNVSRDNCYYRSIHNKLAEYEDLEEQGLLLKLPCKLGSTVYYIDKKIYKQYYIEEMGVEDITFRDNEFYISLYNLTTEYFDFCITSDDIGKTVFLTKEEAEQELKRLEGAE